MKKTITAIITTALILSCLTACSDGNAANIPSDQSSASTADSSSSETSSASYETSSSSASSETSGSLVSSETSSGGAGTSDTNVTVSVYGKVEIPDIPEISEGEYGYAGTWEGHPAPNPEKLKLFEGCLDCMEFETHTLGDYTVKLMGDKVRRDSEKFPDHIFVQHLRVEVEKNGEHIGDINNDGNWLSNATLFGEELRLDTGKIGSYVDLYDLEVPVIAFRYWHGGERELTQCVSFIPVTGPFTVNPGSAEKGIGAQLGMGWLEPSEKDWQAAWWSMFGADEFKVVDKNTLLDEEKGIEFKFDFSNDIHNRDYRLFTAKWVKR